MQRYLFALIVLLASTVACKKITSPRPPCEAQDVVIRQDTSYLSTPLVIPTQLIEDKLNRVVGQNVLDDDNFENVNKKGKRDKLKLKITRLGDIQVLWKNNVASYEVPLVVLIHKQIVSKNVLPTSKSVALKTEFSLRVAFQTTVNIGEDWQLQPSSKLVSYEWLSDVKVLGGLINVKKIIEKRLDRQMPQILESLDSTIRVKVRLERAVTRVWKNLQKPIIIHRKKELVWLKINPIQFELGTITTEGGNLMIQSRLSATTETLLGPNPVYTIDSILPPLIKRPTLPNETYFYMLSEIPYQDINNVLEQKLQGHSFPITGHNVKIKKAKIWGCGQDIVLHISVGGAIRGDIYFQGTPHYEPDSQKIVINNFDYEVETEEVLSASADWLLHSTFKEEIKSALSLPLGEKIAQIPNKIMLGIEKGRAGKKLDFTIEEWDFRPQKIWIRPTDIVALIIVNAQIRLELEKI